MLGDVNNINNKCYHILLSGNNAWGMWNFRVKLVEHLLNRGFKVSISAPYDKHYFDCFKKLGCEVYDVPIDAKGSNPIKDLMLICKYIRLMKRIKPNLSITYTIKPNIYASIAADKLRIPFLPITTGLGYTFLSKGLVPYVARLLYRYSFRRANEVWFLNKDDIETFKLANLVNKTKVVQLPGEGIDTAKFCMSEINSISDKDKSFVFLLIGRLLKDKGIIEYVEAARILKKKYPKIRFQLLGAIWPENPAAIKEEEVENWQKDGIIEYLGYTNDVRPYLGKSSCVVLPSYREGVPCTLMEGAAMCKPIIATNVPGCREVVKDGYNGYLCEVKNVADLADKMEKMMLLPELSRIKMGVCGRKFMEENFDIHLIIRQYDNAINRMLGI